MVVVHVFPSFTQFSLKQGDEFGLRSPNLLVGPSEIRELPDPMWMLESAKHRLQRSLVRHQPTFKFALDTKQEDLV